VNPFAIYLDGNGPLQQSNGDNKAAFVFFVSDDNTFNSGEGSSINTDPLALVEIRPRLCVPSGSEDCFDCGDFLVRDRQRLPSGPNHVQYSGSDKDGEPFPDIESAEYVTGKQRQLDMGDPIRPSLAATIAGHIRFVTLASQRSSRRFFELKFCPETIPQVSGRGGREDRFT
jgi:hypothetical protein